MFVGVNRTAIKNVAPTFSLKPRLQKGDFKTGREHSVLSKWISAPDVALWCCVSGRFVV